MITIGAPRSSTIILSSKLCFDRRRPRLFRLVNVEADLVLEAEPLLDHGADPDHAVLLAHLGQPHRQLVPLVQDVDHRSVHEGSVLVGMLTYQKEHDLEPVTIQTLLSLSLTMAPTLTTLSSWLTSDSHT